jgi:hypothetical protein
MVMHWGHVSGRVVNGRVIADVCGCDLGPAENPDASRRDDSGKKRAGGKRKPR